MPRLPKEQLAKGSRLPKDALKLYYFMQKARFPLTLDDLEATVATREALTVIQFRLKRDDEVQSPACAINMHVVLRIRDTAACRLNLYRGEQVEVEQPPQ